MPVFEKSFIHDSYSCRVGKGTHYGIKRIDKFIRSSVHVPKITRKIAISLNWILRGISWL
jgi:hypothetical protein